ncbi:MAG: hypothetical protein II161_03820, partial [Erysipelotrichaceae bacterium]|nr:hypothetical protein [Erysipelotrichaceae bacterium]
DSASVQTKEPVLMKLHNNLTELNIQHFNAETQIVDNELTLIETDVNYTGGTAIFNKEKPENKLQFEGNAHLHIDDLRNDDTPINGSIHFKTTDNYEIDSIPEVDKITLLSESGGDMSFTEEGPEVVTGQFGIRYEYIEENKLLHSPLNVSLKFTDMKYLVKEKKFGGKADLTLDDDLVLGFENTKTEQTVTLLKGAELLHAEVTDNKLTKLYGDVNFKGHFDLGSEKDVGNVEIPKGNAHVDFNVKTGEISQFKISADATCDYHSGGTPCFNLDTPNAPCHIEAEADNAGLSSASFSGLLHGRVDIDR